MESENILESKPSMENDTMLINVSSDLEIGKKLFLQRKKYDPKIIVIIPVTEFCLLQIC